MTPELANRLERSLPPFDGDCVRNEGILSLPQLRLILVLAVDELRRSCAFVHTFHDWHEHDGFIVEAQRAEWNSITTTLETERTLFDSRDVDFGVRIAIFPLSFEWLLRYNIDDEVETDYQTATCDFDLTVTPKSEALGILDALATANPSTLMRCPAGPWFRSMCGG